MDSSNSGVAFSLPGIAIDGKNGGERLIIACANAPDGTPVYGMWIVYGENEDSEAHFICEVLGAEEYAKLYKFFEPHSDGDIQL